MSSFDPTSGSSSITDDEEPPTMVPPFDPDVHLNCPEPTLDQQLAINNFRTALEELDLYQQHKEWADDRQLLRFLIARNFNQKASFDLMIEALKWRDKRQPGRIEKQENWERKMSKESETGKIYCPGYDRWGRSVLVFDNTVQNTPHVDDHMLFLAWNLEFAIKMMQLSPGATGTTVPAKPDGTTVASSSKSMDAGAENSEKSDISAKSANKSIPDKYLVFMHLTNFSFFNTPPLQSTRETIHMVCTCFPERLGHCIAYQPPAIFKAFFNTVKGFLDPKTANKMVFIVGDVSDGSENDLLMKRIIGNNWKTLTGAEQEVVKPGNSPGYHHEKFWPTIRYRLDQYEQQEEVSSRKDYSVEDDDDDNNGGKGLLKKPKKVQMVSKSTQTVC
jgi:hypothetical protein